MSKTVRAFIALTLPETVRTELVQIQSGLQSHRFKVRWVPAANIHLTLAFLGDVPLAALDPLCASVEKVAAAGPMMLQARAVGVFPTARKPRVIWAGMAGQRDQLTELKQQLDTALVAVDTLTYKRENRPFKAHLTLGRVKHKIDARLLASALNTYSDFESTPFSIDAVHVMQSKLSPEGAVYTELMRAPLGG